MFPIGTVFCGQNVVGVPLRLQTVHLVGDVGVASKVAFLRLGENPASGFPLALGAVLVLAPPAVPVDDAVETVSHAAGLRFLG